MLLSPKLFFAFALALAGGYLLLAKPKDAEKRVDPEAVRWVMTRLDASTGTLPSPAVDGSLESLKAANDARMDTITDAYQHPAPQAAAPTADELTVAALIRALEAALRSVPDAIPHLPLVPGMVHAIMREDPKAITFGPTPDRAWGYYTPRGPDGRPKIVLNDDLKRLHTRGVPTPMLADILLHELDHWMLYALGKQKGMRRNDIEESAFRSEGYYLSAMLPNKGKGGDAVDATGDPERDAYLAELRKIRAKMLAGELPAMIRQSYGPDPSETADGSGAQRR